MSNPTLTAVAALAAAISPTQQQHEGPKQLVDALHTAFGEHHARAVHAKGVMLTGRFTPTAEARLLSRAAVFSGPELPITVRFSDFTGIPDIPDTVGVANPRGFAVKFHVADGSEVDIVNHSFDGFPTKTSDEFAQLLRAIGGSGPGSSKPTALDQFLDAHPIAKTFLTTQLPAPVSYSTLAYFGVNSFRFVNRKGAGTYVRYRFIPGAGVRTLTEDEIKAKGPNYLSEEISTRVASGPLRCGWRCARPAPPATGR